MCELKGGKKGYVESKKLTKEELLNYIEVWKSVCEEHRMEWGNDLSKEDEQAYQRLKEIVEEHFKDSTGYTDLLTEVTITINSQKELLESQSKEITRLLMEQRNIKQQKPEVE